MEPRELAEEILRDHEARVKRADHPWRWEDDPEEAGLVALAAMATGWNLTPLEFEAKLERLRHTPTGVARRPAERMLELWHRRRRR